MAASPNTRYIRFETASTSSSETWKARCRSPNRVGSSSTEACTRPWMTALVQAIRLDFCSIAVFLRLRLEAHFGDLVLARALGGPEGDRVAALAPDEGPGQGRRDGDATLLDVGLEVSHDAVGDVVAAVGVGQLDGGPEHHPRARELARI